MDPTPLLAAAIAGVIAATTQLLATRSAGDTSQRQIDYQRWEAWRRDGAGVWADLVAAVRDLERDFDDLAGMTDKELEDLRNRVQMVVHDLDRLSVLALDRTVGDWSRHVARSLSEIRSRFPTDAGCVDEETALEFHQYRDLLHARFDWNDGDRSTPLERFREALDHSIEPPARSRRRRRRYRLWTATRR